MKRRWFSKPVFVIDKTPNLDPSKPRTIAQHIMRHEEAGWTFHSITPVDKNDVVLLFYKDIP